MGQEEKGKGSVIFRESIQPTLPIISRKDVYGRVVAPTNLHSRRKHDVHRPIEGVPLVILQRLQETFDDPTNTAIPQVSLRDQTIITSLLKGMKNREIAEEMGYSEQTVKNRLGILFRLYGVKSRRQLSEKIRNQFEG